jgi:hypothetical protein
MCEKFFRDKLDTLLKYYLCDYRSKGPGFDFRRYQIFREVVGLERSAFSLVSTIEELLGRNSSGSGLENREDGRGDTLRWPRDTLYPQELVLTSPTCGGRSVGVVRLRTENTEFVFVLFCRSCNLLYSLSSAIRSSCVTFFKCSLMLHYLQPTQSTNSIWMTSLYIFVSFVDDSVCICKSAFRVNTVGPH